MKANFEALATALVACLLWRAMYHPVNPEQVYRTYRTYYQVYRARWPICSVPKLPIPFRRKAKTTRFSFRRPTLKLEN